MPAVEHIPHVLRPIIDLQQLPGRIVIPFITIPLVLCVLVEVRDILNRLSMVRAPETMTFFKWVAIRKPRPKFPQAKLPS